MIEVELPDGTIAEFPDGTSNDVIKGALQKRFSAPAPDAKPKAQFAGGMAGAGALGAADTLSFGFGDELGAGLGAASEYIASKITGQEPRSYDEILGRIRDQENRAKETNPGSYLTGQVAGALTGGAGLAKGGVSATANALRAGKGLGRVSLASAKETAALGGLHGYGSGEGVKDRVGKAATGVGTGLLLGGVTPAIASGLAGVVRGAVQPVSALFRPEKAADKALATYLKRSGMTVDDIRASLQSARDDGQDMFTVADALGNTGQRALVPAVRTPNDARQEIFSKLTGRQVGQGDRLSNYMAEAFDAPDTAAQRAAKLQAERSATADTNYTAARQGANPVNLNDAIGEIDTLLGRDPILGETALSAGPLGPRLRALRDQLAKGDEQLIDFDKVLNIKSDLYQQMQRNPQVANDMRGVYSQLDAALENASGGYRSANDTFRQQSKVIDAVDTGKNAVSGRMRSADTIPQFNAMTPEEQAAFRAGYVDPYIARIESTSMSPTTNKARGLITPKTGEEFPAFAAPGKADQLGSRVAREQRMFETSNAALGGSKTADNLADMDEAANFDPAILSNLFSGNWGGAAMSAARQSLNYGKGMPPRAIERVGRSMMETDPALAADVFGRVQQQQMSNDRIKALILSGLLGNNGAGAGRSPNVFKPD